MLSSVPSVALGSKPFQTTNPGRYSFKNFQLCPKLQNQLTNIAIRYISAELLKSLIAIKRNDFLDARRRVDAPHGLFGFSLENFKERRKGNVVYLDVLELVCRETLEKAKFCIVMDELQDYLSRLFKGYNANKMEGIKQDIKNSYILETFTDTIAKEYKKNSDRSQRLRDQLKAFNVRERNAVNYVNNQVYTVQNNCIEAALLLDPIELRYKLDFTKRIHDQVILKIINEEEKMQTDINDLVWTCERELLVNNCIRVKQHTDIELLKAKIAKMNEKLDRDFEKYDGSLAYKKNAMELMTNQHKDWEAKLIFFAHQKEVLQDWLLNWEKRTDDGTGKKKKKKKKK